MKQNKVFPAGKVVLTGLILATIFTYLHALVLMNGIPPYLGGDGKAIESRVMKATSIFLESNADAFLLFSEVETGYEADFDFKRGGELADSAIEKLACSREHYAQVLAVAAVSEYDAAALERLRCFDYRGFATKNNLLVAVMERVAKNLSNGDIPGVLRRNLAHVDQIILGMQKIRELMQQGICPPIESIWKLLQNYSDAILYGNYATLVFYNA
ncbi:MAG TPA: hypothetical protein ENN40_08675 [Candidatus Aminicenantes bacterium]|nr:hypothetical protein [Candidatus Aminicenantes bacterium]